MTDILVNKNIVVYQKYIKTSARVGYAPPIWKRAQVQGLQDSSPV